MSKSIYEYKNGGFDKAYEYLMKSNFDIESDFFNASDLIHAAKLYTEMGMIEEVKTCGNVLRAVGYNEKALDDEILFYRHLDAFDSSKQYTNFDTVLSTELNDIFSMDQDKRIEINEKKLLKDERRRAVRSVDSVNYLRLKNIFTSGKKPTYSNVGFFGMRDLIVLLVHICRYEKYTEYFSVDFMYDYVNMPNGIPRSQASWILKDHYQTKDINFMSQELPNMVFSDKEYSYNMNTDSFRYQIGLLPIRDLFTLKSKELPEEYVHDVNAPCNVRN